AQDCWNFNDVLGTGSNPTSTLTLTHTGSSGTTALNFSPPLVFNNITANGNTTLGGNTTVAGSLAVSNAGNFTNSQQNDYITSSVNGLNFGTMFSGDYAGNFATEAIAGGVVVPSNATVLQPQGIAGYAKNNSASATVNAVGAIGLCDNLSTGGCWGG